MHPNPFHTPAQAAAASIEHAVAAAPAINEALDKGERVFGVPPGLAVAIQAMLRQKGWGAEIGAREVGRTTIVVLDPPPPATNPIHSADLHDALA